MVSQANIRDLANDVAENAKHLLCKVSKASKESSHSAQAAGKQLLSFYPHLVSNSQSVGKDALKKAKYYSAPTKYGVSEVTSKLGRDVRFVESCLIHVGLGYLLVKLYSACNSGTAPASAKLKAHINEKPVESVLIALGAGYLLGKIFR